jgi:hypothetical protein
MHAAILALSLSLLVPRAIAQSISFLPPSNSSSDFTFPQATNYDLYKNSKFTANCSFPFTQDTSGNVNADYTGDVVTAFAQSQAEFCAKLKPEVPWFVWPTSPTNAAYLPNWIEVLFSLAVLSGKLTWGLLKLKFKKHESLFGKLDWAILVYDVGQFGVWWYCTISGFSEPLHANWVDPIQWLTPISYIFLILSAESDTRIWARRLAILVCIALAGADSITGLSYISQRFTDGLGAGSYIPLDPLPNLPESITSTCRDLLQDPTSYLYSDPNRLVGRLTQVIVAGSAAFLPCAWAPVMVIAWYCNINVNHGTALITYFYGIVVQFIALIWLSQVATRAVPLMLHEGCGVVVIAMSPKLGYYDSWFHYEGLQLQALRGAFGVCMFFFVQTGCFSEADCTSQRRLYIRPHVLVCVG